MKLAKDLRPRTEEKTRIQGLPWVKKDVMKLEDIYTDVTLEKVEQKPTGTVKTQLNSYTELFGQNVPKAETPVSRQKRNKGRKVKGKRTQKLKLKNSAKDQKQDHVTDQEEQGKKMLFTADPGMGKTSLMKKVTYDWVKGIFTVFTIVFFVSVKLVKPGDPIENIIIDQNPKLKGLKVSPQKLRALLENFGNQCLLIFDGFDENDSNRDEILKILRGEELLACSVIVTTRPHSEGDISQYFQIVCEVCGFQRDRPSKFISKRLKDKTKTTAVLNFYRRNFVKIGSEQFSPLILLFVCALVDVDSVDLSESNVFLGEIYFRIVRSIYVAYLKRKRDESYNSSTFLDVVKKMGKLAWETLIEGKKTRQMRDICKIDENAFKYGYLVGYEDERLQIDETADIFVMFSYNTIEEFFVSYHFVNRLMEENSVEKVFGADCRKPIFTRNRLFLHFCLWFLFNDQPCISEENKQIGLNMLVSYASHLIDVPQLDFACIAGVFPAFLHLKGIDDLSKMFWKEIISRCCKVKQFLLDSNYLLDFVLDLPRDTMNNLVLIHLVGYRHWGFTFEAKYVPEINPEHLNIVLSLKEETFLDIVRPRFASLRKEISLYVVVTGMESKLNLTNFLKPGITRIHVVCDNINTCQIIMDPLYTPCPNLTHLRIRGMSLDNTVVQNLSNATASGKLSQLSHLDIENTLFGIPPVTLQGKVTSLFSSPWPKLTHLGLNGTLLNSSDIEILSKHDISFPKLSSVQLSLVSASDAIQKEHLTMREGKLNDMYISLERKIDRSLFKLFCTPWKQITNLWLYDMNKNEYRHVMNEMNRGSLPNLTQLGITMWSLMDAQKTKEVPIKSRESGAIVQRLKEPDYLPPVNVETLTSLTMHGFVCSMYHLDIVTQSKVLTQLHKLDISQGSGVTEVLSLLLCHHFPSLENLILSDCGLNAQDLNSLAKANIKGRLPELKYLDISGNTDFEKNHESLFAGDAQWDELVQLNCDQPSATSDKGLDYLIAKLQSGWLKSLGKLTSSVCETTVLSENLADSLIGLKELDFRSPTLNLVKALRNICAGVEKGFLPSLEMVCITIRDPEPDSDTKQTTQEFLLSLQKKLNQELPLELANHVLASLYNPHIHLQTNARFETDGGLIGLHQTEIEEAAKSAFDSMVSSVLSTLSEPITEKQKECIGRHLREFWVVSSQLSSMGQVPLMIDFITEILTHLPTLKHDMQRRNINVFLHADNPTVSAEFALKIWVDNADPKKQHTKK